MEKATKMHFIIDFITISRLAKQSNTILKFFINPEWQQYTLHLSCVFSDLNYKHKATMVVGF